MRFIYFLILIISVCYILEKLRLNLIVPIIFLVVIIGSIYYDFIRKNNEVKIYFFPNDFKKNKNYKLIFSKLFNDYPQRIIILIISLLSIFYGLLIYIGEEECNLGLKTSVWYAEFEGGKYSNAELIIASSIAANRLQGYLLDERELRNQSNKVIKKGFAKYNNRNLPACVEKIELNYVNSEAGERRRECFIMGYISDKEFKIFRKLQVMHCENPNNALSNWIYENEIIGM